MWFNPTGLRAKTRLYAGFLFYQENFERTKRPIVPSVTRPVPVEIGKAAIVGVAAVETIGRVLEICLSPSFSSEIEQLLATFSLSCSRDTPAFF